jgi:integrase/recombinase XerD
MATKRSVKMNTSNTAPLLMAFEEFIREKEILNKSQATINNYVTTYGIFVNNLGIDDNEVKVNQIKQADFYEWIGQMRLEEKKITTINHYLRDMRTFFYWCMDTSRGYIEIPYKIPLLKGQEEQIKLFTDEELEALLERPRKNDSFVTWRTWAMVNWILATGNRAQTVCEVQMQDINFSAKQIHLRHTKNKKASTIPLSSSLETVIKEYIRLFRYDVNPTDYLFSNVGDEQLTTHGLWLAFRKYCNDREVSRTNIHGLRHNFAKGWVMNNGNLFMLQKILGHQTLEMTRRYVRLFSEDLKEDFDTFNPLDNIKKQNSRKQTVKRAEPQGKKAASEILAEERKRRIAAAMELLGD